VIFITIVSQYSVIVLEVVETEASSTMLTSVNCVLPLPCFRQANLCCGLASSAGKILLTKYLLSKSQQHVIRNVGLVLFMLHYAIIIHKT